MTRFTFCLIVTATINLRFLPQFGRQGFRVFGLRRGHLESYTYLLTSLSELPEDKGFSACGGLTGQRIAPIAEEIRTLKIA